MNSSKYGSTSKKPFLSKLHVEFMEVTFQPGYPGTVTVRIPPLNTCSDPHSQKLSGIDLRGGPYSFSINDNVFMMEGCAGSVVLVNQSNNIMAGCGTVCYNYNNDDNNNNSVIPSYSCFGFRCCHTPFSSDTYEYSPLSFYQININSQEEASAEGQNCLVGTIINSYYVTSYVGKLSSLDPHSAPPVVLSWRSPNDINVPRNNPHVSCNNDPDFYCYCDSPYKGNPYVSNGCQAPEGCEGCQGYCLGS